METKLKITLVSPYREKPRLIVCYQARSQESVSLSRSDTLIRKYNVIYVSSNVNCSGPRIDPCGTPLLMLRGLDSGVEPLYLFQLNSTIWEFREKSLGCKIRPELLIFYCLKFVYLTDDSKQVTLHLDICWVFSAAALLHQLCNRCTQRYSRNLPDWTGLVI